MYRTSTFVKIIASHLTADNILLIIDFEWVSYVEITTMLDAQNPELWPTVGYKKLCIDRDLNCGRKLVTKSCV